ncbi:MULTISPECIES: glutaminase [unclassified Undibacterium]|uniref:glutaminase n=1 Tax=unclassified Undibacterium TaxID=2630295 RepID=UPI002AC96D69|nr:MULTISPECIES: glutaminase [unclassified Undibacterium]MEB0138096.1 glutaminase [Undibacterium sp. CCC2.1]MEB0171149.1 glutaminase [Undibacterium sp. CCC1.1]MEB0175194.1 glutaminase [Undibacterium sp. CCC3.4]MEB0214221.1 glutaminase [Undibacterium sp. 5I2]WPX45563.1 glutaminase [Undibacterium sp. CCC3.4]
MKLDYSAILATIYEEVQPLLAEGRVASYIPQLSTVPLAQFAMAIYCLDGSSYQVGVAEQKFSLQSITKLFALALAFSREGDAIWERVGREPSGNPFNSLVQIEHERGKPRNPFINAGALVISDILASRFVQSDIAVLQFARSICGNAGIDFDTAVAESERATAHRNYAIAHLMKDFGNLHNPVEQVIASYCRQCSITMTCSELARSGSFLAQHGTIPWNGTAILDRSSAKRLNALMLTCGTYDAAGDFAYRVGLPAKSGVGGGILAIVPGELAVAVWSPGLDATGNSLAGTYALERFTTLTARSIF